MAIRGVEGTGTVTDAITIVWGGPLWTGSLDPRSRMGSGIARVVCQVVWVGAEPRADRIYSGTRDPL